MYLTLEAIQSKITTTIVGKKLDIRKAVDSTNDVAWEAAKAGKDEGYTILAEVQKEGRGRLGRHWHAPRASSILASILLRPPAVTNGPSLTVSAALAVCRACESNAPVKCRVKWPNDVLIEGKKVAGILVESRVIGKSLPIYVVGVGLNVNLSRPAFPKELRDIATSLRAATKKMYDRNPIVASLLNEFDQDYVLCRERHWSGLEVEFFERLGLADKHVEVKTPNKTHKGLLRAFSIDGGITLERENGERFAVPCEIVTSLAAV